MARMDGSRLAQSVEHQTLNLRVEGSSPSLGDFFHTETHCIYKTNGNRGSKENKSKHRFYRDLNSDRRIQSPEC